VLIAVAGRASVSKSATNTIRVYPLEPCHAIGRIILIKAVQATAFDVQDFRAIGFKQGENSHEVE
jgi:hypothetical protein